MTFQHLLSFTALHALRGRACTLLLAAASMALAPAVMAQTGVASASAPASAPAPASAATQAAAASVDAAPKPQSWVAGEIRRIDIPLGRLTIRHADIPHLEMQAMTMVFRVQPGVLSPAQLRAMQPGDKVEFQAEAPQGQLTVTALRRPLAKPAGRADSAPVASDSPPATHEHHH
ncbi:Cu and Ag efflux protein CusF [Roseateles sp. YR242]|uniref:copper-binding protein n=1 Tax=Roseateles sp. YR242 TaxID=1855305 RepID=UPI0008C50DDA|nr:copper-binding protein [Roseateles sp. YR242]SEL73580.1 Cu and Ag efflux protein CusF [Roseateles sp. YR242]